MRGNQGVTEAMRMQLRADLVSCISKYISEAEHVPCTITMSLSSIHLPLSYARYARNLALLQLHSLVRVL
jgi:hypothetical protein